MATINTLGPGAQVSPTIGERGSAPSNAGFASNNWDGIVITHNSFGRIGVSKAYRVGPMGQDFGGANPAYHPSMWGRYYEPGYPAYGYYYAPGYGYVPIIR
jgi:hypothetical protein